MACRVYAEDETGDFVWEDLIEAVVNGGGVSIKDVDGKAPQPALAGHSMLTNRM